MYLGLNKKGFTLIELLIVVAIIGILAAVGAAVIPGLLENAKINATKANHKLVTDYIGAELIKCEFGGDNNSNTIMKGYLKCEDKKYNNTICKAAVRALQGFGASYNKNFRNPYKTNTSGLTSGNLNSCNDLVKGTVVVRDDKTMVTIVTCASATEKLVSTIQIE